jgi:DNA-binding XRE family transcriptional regulator
LYNGCKARKAGEGSGMKTIRQLRREHGWTQYELAIRVGVHPQAVYLWESGRRTPQVPQLRKLGQIFGMCSDDIDLEDLANPEHHPSGAHPAMQEDA